MSPSFICARQNRETSRAQASWPCWAEATEATRTNGKIKGMTKRNRVMLFAFTQAGTGVYAFYRVSGRMAALKPHQAGVCRNEKTPASHRRKRFLRTRGSRGLFRRHLAGLRGEIAIHHGTATAGEVGALLHHAGGDLRNVRDFGAAEAERIARAHLL